MTAQELNTYIDKVLGNSLRCLLPSYWWKRLLKLVVGYVDSVKDSTENQIKSVTENTENQIKDVRDKVVSLDDMLMKSAFFKIGVTASAEGDVKIETDYGRFTIPSGETKRIPFKTKFKFVSASGMYVSAMDTSITVTSTMTDMSEMFYYCRELDKIDVLGFDTSNVIKMNGMFSFCYKVTHLDVSTFDTSNVKDMQGMFRHCSNLASLDVSNFNTSNVTDMSLMFAVLDKLTHLDLSNFDTSNVTDMSYMFSDLFIRLNNETSRFLDISSFDTSNVRNMEGMFQWVKLESLDLSHFNTSNVTNMKGMFYECYLKNLNISSFDTTNVNDIRGMFYDCGLIENLTLGEGFFKTQYVSSVRFSHLTLWSEESAIQSLVTNSYDRASNGLSTLNLFVSQNVYDYLTDDHKAILTQKGYTIAASDYDEGVLG